MNTNKQRSIPERPPFQDETGRTVMRVMFCLSLAFLAETLIGSSPALAVTAPSSGSFAYDIYDIAVNQILKGPIGFVAGASAITLGAVCAIKQQIMGAVPAILGGAALIKADAITTSLGALV
jgi:hypothetical protein